MQHIFLVIGSCPDVIILNESPKIKIHPNRTVIDCWSPDKICCYTVFIKNIAGNIVEIESIINDNKFVSSVPLGSFVVVDNELSSWYAQRYYSGMYNNNIISLMKEFGITDYKLPFIKRNCKK